LDSSTSQELGSGLTDFFPQFFSLKIVTLVTAVKSRLLIFQSKKMSDTNSFAGADSVAGGTSQKNGDDVASSRGGSTRGANSFGDLGQFSPKKLAKTNVMVKFLHKLALF
jgi:hypothetical protein